MPWGGGVFLKYLLILHNCVSECVTELKTNIIEILGIFSQIKKNTIKDLSSAQIWAFLWS